MVSLIYHDPLPTRKFLQNAQELVPPGTFETKIERGVGGGQRRRGYEIKEIGYKEADFHMLPAPPHSR